MTLITSILKGLAAKLKYIYRLIEVIVFILFLAHVYMDSDDLDELHYGMKRK